MHITQQFLTALFGPEVDALSRILIWSAPGKHSFFTRSAEEAAAQARKLAPRQNVYFGCGLAPKGLAHYERAGSASVRGIPGIWADIDIADPKAHAKTALAPDLDAAIALAVALPLPPTLIVRSGHGIQPWWLFKEPWLFTDEQATQNRAAAQDAVRGWQNLLKAEAAARGWEHDATHDLARVLRLPGTFNHKDPDNLKAVTVSDWHDAQRYNPEDFSGYLLDDGGPYNSPADGLGGSPYSSLAQFEAAAAVPPPLFSAPLPGAALSQAFVTLLDDDPKLKNTWLRKRRNLKDSSLSGYDMALAGILAAYPDIFSDQQIADVLCAFRHKHAEPGSKDWKKGTDHAYLFRTIRRARMQRFADTRLSRLIQSLAAPTYETGPACGPAFESDPACGPAHEINPALGSDPACAPVSETVPAPGPDFPPAPGPACAPLSDPDSETGPAPEFPPVPETAPAAAPRNALKSRSKTPPARKKKPPAVCLFYLAGDDPLHPN